MMLLQTAEAAIASSHGLSVLSLPTQIIIAALPILATIFIFILGYFGMRWSHQERMMLIERSITPEPIRFNENLLLIGIVALCVGIGLIVFFSMYNGLKPALLGGIIPATAGLGVIIFYLLTQLKKK